MRRLRGVFGVFSLSGVWVGFGHSAALACMFVHVCTVLDVVVLSYEELDA